MSVGVREFDKHFHIGLSFKNTQLIFLWKFGGQRGDGQTIKGAIDSDIEAVFFHWCFISQIFIISSISANNLTQIWWDYRNENRISYRPLFASNQNVPRMTDVSTIGVAVVVVQPLYSDVRMWRTQTQCGTRKTKTIQRLQHADQLIPFHVTARQVYWYWCISSKTKPSMEFSYIHRTKWLSAVNQVHKNWIKFTQIVLEKVFRTGKMAPNGQPNSSSPFAHSIRYTFRCAYWWILCLLFDWRHFWLWCCLAICLLVGWLAVHLYTHWHRHYAIWCKKKKKECYSKALLETVHMWISCCE